MEKVPDIEMAAPLTQQKSAKEIIYLFWETHIASTKAPGKGATVLIACNHRRFAMLTV